jgi:uncharacterized protein YbaA (DUF1428 family)
MTYIDGFVAAASTASRATYREHCETMGAVFKEHGALRVVDCWGEDVPDGKLTSFPMAVKKEPGETVVFGWIEWPSRAARDAGFAKAMQDPRMTSAAMPFDGKRMIFGGFDVIADTKG